MITVADVTRNPVLRRELNERASSKRAAVAVTLWLFLLSGLSVLVYFAYSADAGGDPIAVDSARIGKELFEWALFGMLGLVLFLVPAFTAGAVAGERSSQTLIPVQITSLSPLAIVLGKSLAAIAFTVLLVVSAAPILAVAFFVGGVGFSDIFTGLGMIVLTAIMLGSVGIMISSLFRKVQSAIVVSYGFVVLLAIGAFVLLVVVYVVQVTTQSSLSAPEPIPPKEVLAVNPFVALADITAGSDRSYGNNPLSGLRALVGQIESEKFQRAQDGGEQPNPESTAVWRWYVVFCVLAIYSSLTVATSRLRTPAETER